MVQVLSRPSQSAQGRIEAPAIDASSGQRALVSEGALHGWLGQPTEALPDDPGVTAATLRAVLELLPCSAFVADGDGVARHANSRGLRDLEQGAVDLLSCLQRGGDGTEGVTIHALPADANGTPQALVLRDDRASAAAVRLARSTQLWKLTRHQAAVLRLLVHGQSNKGIAKQLACGLRTVEVHVSALFKKSQTSNRGELIAWFWNLV